MSSLDERDCSSIEQVRTHVIRLIASHLSPSKLKDINEEKYQSVAKILFELLSQFPSFFAYDDVSNVNANSCFLEWLFPTLINILIKRQRDGVMDELTRWIIEILKLKKKISLLLLQETMIVLQDCAQLLFIERPVALTCVYYHHLHDRKQESADKPTQLNEVIPNPPAISLCSQEEVVSLLKVVMDIVTPFVLQISLFFQSSVSSLLVCVSNLLFYQDKVLREKTFCVINSLVDVNDNLNLAAMNRLCSACVMYLKCLTETNGFDDNGSVTCLYHVFSSVCHQGSMKPLSVVLLDLLYAGTYNKMSESLKECVGVLMCRCWVVQAISPTLYFDCLCKMLGGTSGIKYLVNITSSILMHFLLKLKSRLSAVRDKKCRPETKESESQTRTSKNKEIVKNLFLKFFDGKEDEIKCDILSDGESTIACFLNLMTKLTSELVNVYSKSDNMYSTDMLCASVEAYSFLIEVYCIMWRHPNLQLSVLVGYDLMDTILHHLQHLLHWTTHNDTESASKNKLLRSLLISTFQVSASLQNDSENQSRSKLRLWLLTLPWKEVDSTNDHAVRSVGLLSHQHKKELKSTVSELYNDDNEIILNSLKGLSSVNLCSWTETKLTILSAALRKPSVQCDIMKCAPVLMVTLDSVVGHDMVNSCLSVPWTTEMMIGFVKRLFVYSLIMAGQKGVIGLKSFHPLKPEYSIDTSRVKSLNKNSVDSVCDSYCHLLQHVLNTAQDPDVFIESIKTTMRTLQIIGSKPVALLLELLNHPNDSVIKCISDHAGVIVDHLPDVTGNISSHPLIIKVKSLVSTGRNSNCELAAKLLGSMGRSTQSNLVHHCIVLLLELTFRGTATVKATAFVQLKKITKHRGILPSKLPVSLKRLVCELLLEILNETPKSILSDEAYMYEVALMFDHDGLSSFLQDIDDVFLPLLVANGSQNALKCIDLIAKTLNKNTRELLYHNFKLLFAHLVCYCSESRRQSSLQFLERTIQSELKEIICSNPVNILTSLLLYLLPHRQQVVAGVHLLAEIEEALPITSDDDLAQYLYPKLLPILKFFEVILVRSSHHGDMEAGRLAVSSFTELLKLMGPKYITPCRVNVMALLRSSRKFKDEEICRLTCLAWGSFVKCVELDCLGPMLCEIVVALTTFLNKFPDIVSDIFKYLIVEHKDSLSSHFSEIYMIPDVPVLAEVNMVLKNTQRVSSNEESIMYQQLNTILKGISHERADVKMHATRALQDILKNNKAEVQKLIVSTDMVDCVITDLISSIVRNLKESNTALKLKCGECLGLLGAIDPGRLKITVSAPKMRRILFEIETVSSDFAVELITELANACLAAPDAPVHNCCAFAIQDAIATYDCTNTDQSSEGAKIWRKLPDGIRDLAALYQKSTYSPRYPPIKSPSLFIFKPSSSLSFENWVQNWTSRLINELPDSKAKTIFRPSTLIFKYNIHLAYFLLPHVLLCFLCLKKDSSGAIQKEISSVLECAKNSRGLLDTKVAMCTQAIFSVLDYLQEWLNHSSPAQFVKGKSTKPSAAHTNHKKIIQNFLSKISKELLAHAAYNCHAYTRALRYLEQYLSTCEDEKEVQTNLKFLQQVFASLNDYDGVTGVAAIRKGEPSLSEQILQFESSGDFHDAADCYRRGIQKDPKYFRNHEGLLQCMVNLGEFTSVLHHLNGLIAERQDWAPLLNSYRVESAWKLGNWSCLDQTLKQESLNSQSWGVGLGRVLQSARQKDFDLFNKNLLHVRSSLMGPLAATSLEQGSYQSGYEYIIKLHMLEEVEEFVSEIVFGIGDISNKLTSALNRWNNRLQSTQESFKTRESILNLHRTLLKLLQLNKTPLSFDLNIVIGNLWLKSAQTARHDNCLQSAHNLLLQTSDYPLPDLMLEKAEWIRCRDDCHQAMMSLQKSIDESWPGQTLDRESSNLTVSSSPTHAKAVLMIGKWMEDTEHESQTILRQYKAAVNLDPRSEECHFCLGKYYDRLLTLVQNKPNQYCEVLQFSIQHYGYALEYGNQFIYHCMPRALSLWLDYSSRLHETLGNKQDQGNVKSQISKINRTMDSLVAKLPPYQFLVAFSQLISRVCHPDSDVFATLKEIILKLIEHYPQQSLWMMIAVNKSTLKPRQKRCQEILDKARKKFPQLERVIKDMIDLSTHLLDVCSYGSGLKCTITSMDKVCRELTRRATHKDFSPIIVPLQSSLTVTLPVGNEHSAHYNPFPGILPKIVGFEDKVEILQSLQKPKKVCIKASDGKSYTIMCKPKDDVRKDCRLMELNSVINKFLLRDPQCRQRHLYIRTYAVVPLNEESGIVEWVENTSGLRVILYKLYREKDMYTSGADLKAIHNKRMNKSREIVKQIFEDELIRRHPPVLAEWFTNLFSDPTAWYSSRQAFCRTVAVMSIVGYIVGLGDRHGENILLDSTNGDCVHVDLSCLFNKGETFDVPEVVPFRLTHNMINAMGFTSYEGTFRTCCEMTMRVLREQKDPLICILKTLIHDPLVEWSNSGKDFSSSSRTTAEPRNEMGVKTVNNIEQRLKGQTGKTLPLSVKGQVHSLIKEATDVYNLSQMYIGWGAYL